MTGLETGMLGASAGASILNGVISHKNTKDTNRTNMEIAKMNNQTAIDMMRESNQFNYDTAKEFFNMENEYNDPKNVRARMENAGYNPFFDSNTSAFANNGDGATPTSVGVPSLQQPNLSVPPSILNGVLEGVTSAMEKIASAKKMGAETSQVESMLSRQIKSLDIQNEWNQFKMELDKAFEWSNKSWQNEQIRANVQETFGKIANLAEDTINKQKTGKILDLDFEIKQFDKIIKKNESDWSPKMLKQAFVNAVKQGNAIDASADASRASAESSRASARKTIREIDLLGKTYNGVVMSDEQLDQIRNTILSQTENQYFRNELEGRVNALKKNYSENSAYKFLVWLETYADRLPVVGSVLRNLDNIGK